MQITFDPTDKREADFVRKMLAPPADLIGASPGNGEIISDDLQQRAEAYVDKLRRDRIAPEDYPDAGADRPRTGEVVIHSYEETKSPTSSFAGVVTVLGAGGAGGSVPPSATPLPPEVPAPSIAAADVFPIAPAALQASIPLLPPVPAPPAATAPPPAAVPSAPAAPTNHASGVQLDKRGIPHDPRIHSKEPTLTESGVWRKRRGLNDEAYVKRIEEELQQLIAIPTLGAPAPSAAPLSAAATVTAPATFTASPENGAATAAVPPAPPVPIPPAPVAATVSVPPPPVTSAIPPAPPVPPAPVGVPSTVPTAPLAMVPASITVPRSFADFMKLVTSNITSRRLTEAEVHEELRKVGLGENDIGKLALRGDLRDEIAARLVDILASRGA